MDYPMTAFEIWKHLTIIGQSDKKISSYELAEVIECLDNKSQLLSRVASLEGFYFLKGRGSLVRERIHREKISAQKLKKIFKAVRYLRMVPFIQFVGATGRVAMKNAKASSDLDLLIAFKPGKIFLGRFLVFLILQILGKRRHNNKIANRICLNHFLSSDSQPQMQDIFSAHEYSFMLPIFYSKDGSFSWENSFAWVKEYQPNCSFTKKNSRTLKDARSTYVIRKALEILFGFVFWEKLLKHIQTKKISHNARSQNKQGVIIVTDQELAFWPEFEKQGPRIWEEFAKNFQQTQVDEL